MSDSLNPTRRGNTTQLTKDDSALNYVLITGPGRSGTTWLGRMMDSYEHCSYKFEPFGRSPLYREWKNDLESGDVEELRRAIRKSIDALKGKFLWEYRDRLEEMSPAQLGALIWRIQVEPLVDYTCSYPQGLVVVYEDLCTDPQGKITEIFDFVSWELGQSTRDFINKSTADERQFSNKSKARYSVYHDPQVSMSKWKKQLTTEQQADIASVIRESPLKDFWSDLPI